MTGSRDAKLRVAVLGGGITGLAAAYTLARARERGAPIEEFLIEGSSRLGGAILTEHAEGLVLPVRAQPRARKPGILGEQAGALKVAVTAPPEDGRANEALVEALANCLAVKRSQVALLAGATARDKRFLIRGLTKTTLEQRLAGLLSPST